MKFVRVLAGTAIVAAGLVAVEPARASMVNFDGQTTAGFYQAGQYGNISAGGLNGYLAPDLSVTFDYTVRRGDSLNAYGAVNEFATVNVSIGPTGGYSITTADLGGPGPASSIIFATADVTPITFPCGCTGTEAAITLTNLAPGTVFIDETGGNGSNVSYTVSAVPLPASFPMFAAMLAGLAGFSVYRNRREV